jgi:hypothetical protein
MITDGEVMLIWAQVLGWSMAIAAVIVPLCWMVWKVYEALRALRIDHKGWRSCGRGEE